MFNLIYIIVFIFGNLFIIDEVSWKFNNFFCFIDKVFFLVFLGWIWRYVLDFSSFWFEVFLVEILDLLNGNEGFVEDVWFVNNDLF